jgi:hypothetical protein
MNKLKRLVMYNLETDLNSYVLAAAHDWIESFAQFCDEVVVYSTHVGRVDLPSNVVVREIGGGSAFKRAIAVTRLIKSFVREIPKRRSLTVFHHMSTRSLLITGLFYKLMGVKQGLWYSHSKKSISLKFSYKFADKIFTSIPGAIPISGAKVKYVGHGINSKRFLTGSSSLPERRDGIVALGRVTPVKKIESLIDAVSISGVANVTVTCLGPADNASKYPENLLKEAKKKGVVLILKKAIPYSEIPNALSEFDSIFTGTPKSVDKAVIEGALCGCFVISSEEQALNLTGMNYVLQAIGFESIPTIDQQIIRLNQVSTRGKERLRLLLRSKAAEMNDVDKTTQNILRELE